MTTGRQVRADLRRLMGRDPIPSGVRISVIHNRMVVIEHSDTVSSVTLDHYAPGDLEKRQEDIREMFSTVRRRMARNAMDHGERHPAWTFLAHPVALWAALVENPDRTDWGGDDFGGRDQVDDTPELGTIRIGKRIEVVARPRHVTLSTTQLLPETTLIAAIGRPIAEYVEMPSCGRDDVDQAAMACAIAHATIGERPLETQSMLTRSLGTRAGHSFAPLPNTTILQLVDAPALTCGIPPAHASSAWMEERQPIL